MLKNKNRGKKTTTERAKLHYRKVEQCPKLQGKFMLMAERN